MRAREPRIGSPSRNLALWFVLTLFGVVLAAGAARALPVTFTATLKVQTTNPAFDPVGPLPLSYPGGLFFNQTGTFVGSASLLTASALGQIGIGSMQLTDTAATVKSPKVKWAGGVITSVMGPVTQAAGTLMSGGGPSLGFGGAIRFLGSPMVKFTQLSTGPLTIALPLLFGSPYVPLLCIGPSTCAPNPAGWGSRNIMTPIYPYSLTAVPVSATGKNWTTGMVSAMAALPFANPTSYQITTLTGVGSNARTANGLGTIQLVTPFVFGDFFSGPKAGVATLTLTFSAVPEPGALGLLGLGAASLAVWAIRGRSRN